MEKIKKREPIRRNPSPRKGKKCPLKKSKANFNSDKKNFPIINNESNQGKYSDIISKKM